jgi:NAD dependent epimerase/dehydratase family enzyme
VGLEDAVGIITYVLKTDGLSGTVNVVAPNPVRNAELATTLGRVLHRPALLPTPGFVLHLALGEMAGALLLSSQRVIPQKLQQHRYPFVHQALEGALRGALKRAG